MPTYYTKFLPILISSLFYSGPDLNYSLPKSKKIKVHSHQVEFPALRTCLYCLCVIRSWSNRRNTIFPKEITERWLRIELRRWYGKMNVTSRLAMLTYSKLSKKMDPLQFDEFMRGIDHDCRLHSSVLPSRKSRKIDALISKRDWRKSFDRKAPPPRSEKQFYPRLNNYSNAHSLLFPLMVIEQTRVRNE